LKKILRKNNHFEYMNILKTVLLYGEYDLWGELKKMNKLKGEKIDDFVKLIRNSKIAKHSDFLLKHLRPSVEIILNKNTKTYLGCSRFGGTPDLPIGTEFPTYKKSNKVYPYRFIGQINFSDIPSEENGIPKNGLLSLFVADYIDDDGLWWGEEGYVYAIYTPDLTNLENISSPQDYPFMDADSVVIEFRPTFDFPFDEYQVEDFPVDLIKYGTDEYNEYHKIRNFLHGENYLLGYPSHCSLAYNPTPEGEWISLLTLNSDDNLKWCWHDGDYLMLFIKKEDLKKLNFSNLASDAG